MQRVPRNISIPVIKCVQRTNEKKKHKKKHPHTQAVVLDTMFGMFDAEKS